MCDDTGTVSWAQIVCLVTKMNFVMVLAVVTLVWRVRAHGAAGCLASHLPSASGSAMRMQEST